MKNVIQCKSELGEEGYIVGDFCVPKQFYGLKLTNPWKKYIYTVDENGKLKIVGFCMLPQSNLEGWIGYTGNKRWITFAFVDEAEFKD